jgi:rubrerythrin
MTFCKHTTLELLPSRKRTLRCRQCHLTLAADELGDDPCPECLERLGKRHFEFEELESANAGSATYRCEECGAIVKCL